MIRSATLIVLALATLSIVGCGNKDPEISDSGEKAAVDSGLHAGPATPKGGGSHKVTAPPAGN